MKKYDFDKLLKPLIQIYDEIELDIIKNILNKLVKYDNVQGSLNWYLEKLTELKALEKENLKVILKDKNAIQKELEKIIENVGFKVDNLDKLKSYYDKGLIEANPINLYNSSSIKSLMSEALTDCTTIMDLINTKAIEGSNMAYRNIINKAYVETASGIYTYSESIRNALKEFAVQGIKTVNYENGLSISIESAIRRDVVTRVNKLVGDKEIQVAKELKTNLMYVDQHLGARVRTKYMKNDYEAHAEWQGKKYMIEGSSKEYPNLYEKTGYGEMLGLKGINCYHHMQPTWEWEKIPNRIDEIENKEKYDLFQKQRSYERKMRALKRERLIAKETDDKENVTKINKKIKSTSEDFNKWLEDNNLTRDYNREYVSQETHLNQQALSANDITFENHLKPKLLEKIDYNDLKMVNSCMEKYEKVIISDKIENAIVITSNGNVYQCFGNENSVWPNVDLGNELINAYVTHNHPIKETGFSFSSADVNLFESYNLKKLRGIDEKYLYELDRSKNCNLELPKFDEELEDTTFEHLKLIEFSINKNIFYRRVKNEEIMEQNK